MNIGKSTGAQGHKCIRTLIICAFIFCILFCRTSADIKADDLQKEPGLQVYLPREVTIKDDIINLGEVSIVRCDPCEGGLGAKASKIPLGRISVPGQEIVVDRSMILSRLACNGIPSSRVTLTGAEQITIKREHKIIKGNEFVELAGAFLKKNPPSGPVCEWEVIRVPKDLIVPEKSKEIKLVPRLAKGTVKNQAKVGIAVVQDGNAIGEYEVTFRLKYKCHKVVTLLDIPKGEVISSRNVKIENSVANFPEPVDWKPPYGLIAKRALASGTVVQSNMVGPVKPEIVIERNQNVVIRIVRPLLVVTAMGKAMQDGREGEYIKVRNQDSQRIVLAKVKEDGTVEPIF